MLASPLGANKGESSPKRFSLREWNELARVIAASEIRRPGALLGMEAGDVQRRTGVDEQLADRIARLLSRGVELSIELDRLRSRGIWTITRADAEYPVRWRERLKERAPAVIFGAGNASLLSMSASVAVVGSRNVDQQGIEWTRSLASRCVAEELGVVSGAARGVDRCAMLSAIEAGGRALAILAESLTQMIRHRELRDQMSTNRLALVTVNHPEARFLTSLAMDRNKYIYALSDWAVVVASASGEGGTWAGAAENLRSSWAPMFVRNGADVPLGNRRLIEMGATAMRLEDIPPRSLRSWLSSAYRREATGSEAAVALAREARPVFGQPTRPPAEPCDAFSLVWPRLMDYLREPRTEAQVAEAFHLEASQARKWLTKALDQGLAEKLKRPTRFRAVSQQGSGDSQPDLFER